MRFSMGVELNKITHGISSQLISLNFNESDAGPAEFILSVCMKILISTTQFSLAINSLTSNQIFVVRLRFFFFFFFHSCELVLIWIDDGNPLSPYTFFHEIPKSNKGSDDTELKWEKERLERQMVNTERKMFIQSTERKKKFRNAHRTKMGFSRAFLSLAYKSNKWNMLRLDIRHHLLCLPRHEFKQSKLNSICVQYLDVKHAAQQSHFHMQCGRYRPNRERRDTKRIKQIEIWSWRKNHRIELNKQTQSHQINRKKNRRNK